jgi:hypothetical protein
MLMRLTPKMSDLTDHIESSWNHLASIHCYWGRCNQIFHSLTLSYSSSIVIIIIIPYLEFPLSWHHLAVRSCNLHSSIQTSSVMCLQHVSAVDTISANSTIVGTLSTVKKDNVLRDLIQTAADNSYPLGRCIHTYNRPILSSLRFYDLQFLCRLHIIAASVK